MATANKKTAKTLVMIVLPKMGSKIIIIHVKTIPDGIVIYPIEPILPNLAVFSLYVLFASIAATQIKPSCGNIIPIDIINLPVNKV